MINRAPIAGNIESLIIDETGKVPKIKLIFEDSNGSISGPNYPKNNPILSIYIKTGNEKYKAISGDFIITNIKSNLDTVSNPETVGINPTYIMTGELYIPKMYNNFSKSYSNLTSREAMRSLAEDLDLGFVEQDLETQDSMTWINPNQNGLWFMNHISKHAYSSEDSFFDSFIDRYYNMTLIDVSQQLVDVPTKDLQLTYLNTADSSLLEASIELKNKSEDSEGGDLYDQFTYLLLTNEDRFKGQSSYVINYLMHGEMGKILKEKGFRKKVYYYDHLSEEENKNVEYWINSAKIQGKNEESRLIPNDETLKSNFIKKWINIDYGNNHPQWNGAAIQNDHNISELKKVNLKVETAGVNFEISRGYSVPLYIYKSGMQLAEQEIYLTDGVPNPDSDSNFEEEPTATYIDQYLTGTYYVSGVRIIYDKYESPRFKTEFTLSRINWLTEKNISEDAT